jgi:DNA-binding SARP family transcriptional activator
MDVCAGRLVSTDGGGAVTTIRYEILGPLRVWRDGAEVDLGPAKQRAVLAYLLLHANQPVSTNAIVDAVWGDAPPANGANVVQKHIAGLRRTLEPDRSPRTGSGVLTLTNGGYALAVATGTLDVDLVDDLLVQSRGAKSHGNLADAATLARRAVDTWRSDALAGMSGHVFDTARERFADIRAGALEEWADAQLGLGHHTPVALELKGLVARYPVRERLQYLLILALYRSGRQADALAAYRDAHRFLTDEYGITPGDELTMLHQQILRADPALAAPRPELPLPTSSPANPLVSRQPALAFPPHPLQPRLFGPAPIGSGVGFPVFPAGLAASSRSTPIPRAVGILAAIAGGLLIVVSVGFATWGVIGLYAAFRRNIPTAVAALGYLVCAIGSVAIIVPGGDNDPHGPILWPLAILWIGMLAGGIAHLAVLAVLTTRKPASRAPTPHDIVLEQSARRDAARQILGTSPELARALAIGQPHLSRTFDDGGLIDINTVPEHVMAMMTGLSPLHAHHIVRDRDVRGPYRTLEDVVTRGLLDTVTLGLLRHLLIIGPTETAEPSVGGGAIAQRVS